MNTILRKLIALGLLAMAGMVAVSGVFTGAFYYVEPDLPAAAEMRNVENQVPLRVYSRDGLLISQFGEQKRTPVSLDEMPEIVVTAFLAAEDHTFFDHPGIDFAGTARAALNLIAAGGDRVPGGSTITQQVAREYFLTRDFSLVRKFRELIMAVRIEREFTKEEILELYLNTVFLGQRSYGVVAAAQTYFDKRLEDLTIAEAALIAGLPQGPSRLNPVANPAAARDRRSYVLRRLREIDAITVAEHEAASQVEVKPTEYGARIELQAPYVAEMVRAEMFRRYGQRAYTAGLKVTATVDSRLQRISNRAIREALHAYDTRHGYRGAVAQIALPPEGEITDEALTALLTAYPGLLDFETGLVVETDSNSAEVFVPGRGRIALGLEQVVWARRYITDDAMGPRPSGVDTVLSKGDVIRLRADEAGDLVLAQIPQVQGAFVAVDPLDGAVVALNGGYHFDLDNFNRSVQALRQPGSAMKPFTFSAALEHGFNVASIVKDAPITLEESEQEVAWRPTNYSNRWYGDVSLRYVLEQSINVAAVRVVMETGVDATVDHLRSFGLSEQATPRNLAVSLGAGEVTPLELASAYSVFANGGYRVEPYFVDKVEDGDGNLLWQATPSLACGTCMQEGEELEAGEAALITGASELFTLSRHGDRVISPQNAYLVTDMMKSVIRQGTGRRARALGREDLAGKTGTTNGDKDTWFAGFNSDLAAVSWVGFNDSRSLGRGEQGAATALPMWISFMGEALAGMPDHSMPMPPGIVEVRINPENGLRASARNPNARFEKFRIGHEPDAEPDTFIADNPAVSDQGPVVRGGGEPIF